MEFIRVKRVDLKRTADEMLAREGKNIAITPWRAQSQAENPYAVDEDVLLIYARDDHGDIAGFTGLLPGILSGKKQERIFWVSCWYAHPHYRGGKVSVPLLTESLEITGRRIIHTDISQRTAAYLSRLGDFSIRERKGALIRIRSSLHSRAKNLRPYSSATRLVKAVYYTGLFKLSDKLINAAMNISLASWLKKSQSEMSAEPFDFPSPGQMAFIREKSINDFTRPDQKQIEWWMKEGWLIKKTSRNESLDHRYHFSSFADEFRLIWVEVSRNRERLGIALLNFRDGTIKTPYLWYDKKNESDFFRGLYHHILSDRRNNVLFTSHEAFADYAAGLKRTWLAMERKHRFSAVTAELAAISGDGCVLQDGDGDYLFT